jgi:hypothetical protein
VFIPWYAGATDIPSLLQNAPENLNRSRKSTLDFHFQSPADVYDLDLDSISGLFSLLGQMVDASYASTHDYVRRTWADFESKEFALQEQVELTALKLYRQDPGLADAFLSAYSGGLIQKAANTARNLINTIKHSQWGTPAQDALVYPGSCDKALYAHYVGEYEAESGRFFTVESRVNGLGIEGPFERYWLLLPLAEDQFFVQLKDMNVQFERNGSGQVVALTVISNEKKIRAIRVE